MEGAKSIISQLKDEVDKLSRLYRAVITIGIILILFVNFYGGWIYRNVVDLSDPAWMAAYVVQRASSAIPDFCKKAERRLIAAVPFLAKEAKMRVLELMPILRTEAEIGSRELMSELGTLFSQKLDMAIDGVLELNKDNLDFTFDALGDSGRVEELTRLLESDIIKILETDLRPEVEASLITLKKIDSELKRLQTGKSLSHRDELEKEFIQLWATLSSRVLSGNIEPVKVETKKPRAKRRRR